MFATFIKKMETSVVNKYSKQQHLKADKTVKALKHTLYYHAKAET